MKEPATGWTVEDRWLFSIVHCVLFQSGAAEEEALSGLTGVSGAAVRWDRLLERAIDGGVAPMAYLFFADKPAAIPAYALDRLREEYRLAGVEHIKVREFTRRILAVCADEGLDIVALRGIAFAELLYPDAAIRPVSDIDLLVRPEEAGRLEKLLTIQGYARIPGHANQWTNAAVVVDVHTDLVGGDRIAARRRAARIDMEAVWEAAVPAVIAGMSVRILGWTDTLLACGLHALKHSCDRMLWFADLAALLHTPRTVPWDAVIARARRFRLEKPTYYALSYLTQTIGAPVPGEVLETLRPARTGWLEKRCMDRILRGGSSGRFGEMFTLFMMDHPYDRWRFIKETCFPNREVLEQSYGVSDAGRFSARLRRVRHVADMAYGVIRGGLERSGYRQSSDEG
jgi:hypothetical protein